MNSEDQINHKADWEACDVCGEAVKPGRGASRISHRGNTVNLCSPACLQVFAQEPDPYIARLAKRTREWVLRESLRIAALGPDPDGRFQTAGMLEIMSQRRESNTGLARSFAMPRAGAENADYSRETNGPVIQANGLKLTKVAGL